MAAAPGHTTSKSRNEARIASLVPAALAATRAAALACQPWVGRGERRAADAAATNAMRTALSRAPGRGTVVIGEGEKDDAPMLFSGEVVGTGDGPAFDIAVDPLEGTKLCAEGEPGALATIAFAEAGSMWSPGPAFYMNKLVVGRMAKRAIDLRCPPEENVWHVSRALGKRVRDLRIVVLDKPRHADLIERLNGIGATLFTPPDGDVAGALAAVLQKDADLLMGIGGTPEGVMTACAVRALGGGMQGRLAPQRPDEAAALWKEDIDVDRVLDVDDLVAGAACFVATGVTAGPLLRAPRRDGGPFCTDSLVITPGLVRRVLR